MEGRGQGRKFEKRRGEAKRSLTEREEGSEETGVMDATKRGEEQRQRVGWKDKKEEGEGEGDWEPAELFISKFHT